MRSRPVYLLHISLAVLLLSAAAPAHAVPIVINNGSAPPNPENVIDGADDYSGNEVYVRNVGCPTGWPAVVPDGPCSSPGAVTGVEVVSGGSVGLLRAYDSSTITMSGGSVDQLTAYNSSAVMLNGGTVTAQLRAYDSSTITMSDGGLYSGQSFGSSTITISGGGFSDTLAASGSSTIMMSGGTVGAQLQAYDSSTITMNGGSVVGGDLRAYGSSTITFIGSNFLVDGTPVPLGDLSALTGTLTGTLTNGGSLDNVFYQGGYAGTYTGIIRLVPEPSTASLLALGLVGIAAMRRRGED